MSVEDSREDNKLEDEVGTVEGNSSNVCEVDVEEETSVGACGVVVRDMTASYSEISCVDSSNTVTPGPSRPLSLSYQSNTSSSNNIPQSSKLHHIKDNKPLDLDGVVVHDGDMTHFVADDLEYKIKISSPVTKRGESPFLPPTGRSRTGTPMSASLYRQILTPQIGQIDITVLNDLEYEARKIASSVDNLIENLSDILHSVSSLTAASVEAYRRSVGRTCDALDRNIRAMYTVLARGEEVSRAMAPVRAHASRLVEIRRLLNIFESTL